MLPPQLFLVDSCKIVQ